VIADNGEGDQWSVAFEAVTNRDQHYSWKPRRAGTLALN